MDDLQLKSDIFSFACMFEQVQIVHSLLPYVGIKERLEMFMKQSTSFDIRKMLLASFDDSELSKALVYTAKADLLTEFIHMLNLAKNKQGILKQALLSAEFRDVPIKYIVALERPLSAMQAGLNESIWYLLKLISYHPALK